jgi:cytochrome c peroxidase
LISCATCHDPRLAFTDGMATSFAINRKGDITRNAPTLLNVAFQQSFFYDGRVYQLEQQAIEVIHNPKEVNGDLKKIALQLQAHPTYKKLFQQAFEGTPDSSITAYAIIVCLSEYERKLLSLNSRFDQYLRGNDKALNEREINGYNIFAGKALCGSCHFFPVFNGTVPPLFKDSEFEVLGTPATFQNTGLDQDSGRYSITHMDMHQFAYKTPTVRNIELTAPYMHNGIYKTLEEVIEFYHKGGGVGFGFDVPNQTLPFDSLQLSVGEKEDLVFFLKTLTDTTSWK